MMGGLCSPSLHAQEEPAAPPQPAELPPIMGALYFDIWTLEKEVILRPIALQPLLELGLEPDTPLDAARRKEISDKVTAFLTGRCPLTVDGELLSFEADRANFIVPDPANFIPIEDEAVIPASEATLSVVFVAPLPTLDGTVNLNWDVFTEAGDPVRVVAVDIVGSRVFQVDPAKQAFSVLGRFPLGAREAPEPPPAPVSSGTNLPWLSILLGLIAIPVAVRIIRAEKRSAGPVILLVVLVATAAVAQKFVTMPLAGGGDEQVAAEQSEVIVDRLLRGVYHAFDYRDESKRYDVLDRVAGGDALTDIYLEVSRTLEQRQQDGARVRVHDIRIEKAEPTPLDDRRGFSTECDWEVTGKVGHWGHFHDRTNLYRARLTIEPLGDEWKITGLSLLTRDRQTTDVPEPAS